MTEIRVRVRVGVRVRWGLKQGVGVGWIRLPYRFTHLRDTQCQAGEGCILV